MAIYSFQCKIVARTKRLNNAVAHAAYINRIDLDNNRDGTKWRYGHSHNDVYKSAVLLPDNANKKFSDPAYLWNEVEKKENRSNSRLARSFIISLPNELTPEQNKNLIEDYIKTHMTNKGMIVNYAIHIDDTNNFHAHLMSTTRELDKSGLEFAKKNVIGRTWNDDDFLEGLRKGWADTANTHLARLDHQVRIDHRTLSAQRDEALEQFDMATTAEAKAEALAKAVSLDRPAIKRIWRSKLNTAEGRALREAQQDRRDLQLVVAEETKKSVLSLPQEIVLNNFTPKKIKSKSKSKTTIEKTRPAQEAVLKTADTGGEIKDLKYSSFNKFLLDIKIRYNKHQKNNATKKLNKKIDKIIKTIDREEKKSNIMPNHYNSDYFIDDKSTIIKDEYKDDEYKKLQKFFDDVNKRGVELKNKKEAMLKAEQENKKMLSQQSKHNTKNDDQNDRHIKYK
ncbi:hypothetical protein DLQ75_24005 [Salmonella enterica subsp. enterica serovar Anatum]|nr:hypothetical protein [Salmonella enterica subsp. enterica serovar Anatum]